jgi:esterase/lipase superfamily enzyme
MRGLFNLLLALAVSLTLAAAQPAFARAGGQPAFARGSGQPAFARGSGMSLAELSVAFDKGDRAILKKAWKNSDRLAQITPLGPDAVIDFYLSMGRAFEKLKDVQLAYEAYDQAVETIRAERGENHYSQIEPMRRKAAILFSKKRYADAIYQLDEASRIATKALGPDAPAVKALDAESARYTQIALDRHADLGGNADFDPTMEGGSGAVPKGQPVQGFELVNIFYATHRLPTGSSLPSDFYSGERGPLVYGRATVSVPKSRPVGDIPVPSVFSLEFRPDPEKHFILTSVAPIDSREGFLGAVSGAVVGSRRKEVFVFIHGFNQSFEGGAMRTAQLAADLKIDGAPILYSWPSRASLLSYAADGRQTEDQAMIADLQGFLRDVATRTGATRVNVVAHSMGNRLLVRALSGMGLTAPLFDEVIMAAPDVGVDEFNADWPAMRQAGRHFTLYASKRDKALMISAKINDMHRVGDASPMLLVDGLDSIDTTAASSGLLGHDDFAGTALDDFRAVVWLSLAPGKRCVLKAEQGWWAFVEACPEGEFRDATVEWRNIGDPSEALTRLDKDLSGAVGDTRTALLRTRNRLADMIGKTLSVVP